MKILIVGNMGYVGSVAVQVLRKDFQGAQLIGFDSGLFANDLFGSEVMPENVINQQFFGDIREFPESILREVDAVVILSAISNDPMGVRFEDVTEQINYRATKGLIENCLASGVTNIVFASSCSVYGAADTSPSNERSQKQPLTKYAETKSRIEDFISTLDVKNCSITCLRFGTACGYSPRLRLDLVVNDFVVSAMKTKKIRMASTGRSWRPFIDVTDMAHALSWGVKVGLEKSIPSKLIVNVGSDSNNVRILDLANLVSEAILGTVVEINESAIDDARSYRVDFSSWRDISPECYFGSIGIEQSIHRLRDSINQRAQALINTDLSNFSRLNRLKNRINNGEVCEELYWCLN